MKSAQHTVARALRQADLPVCHGRTASKMTVKETNEAFAVAKRKQEQACVN